MSCPYILSLFNEKDSITVTDSTNKQLVQSHTSSHLLTELKIRTSYFKFWAPPRMY